MPAGVTYKSLQKITLGGTFATVNFVNIPQTYTDLIIIMNAAGTITSDQNMRINNDSGTNYSYTTLTGNGTTPSSARASNQTSVSLNYFGSDSTTVGNNARVIQIMNYANTSVYKDIFAQAGRGDTDGNSFMINLWRSNSAITSLTFFAVSGSYITGSTFNLYGVTAA